ncbi:hypothetical protein [Anoxybacteroides amylolyticum]|uniref:Uncharacterized protein n=1 Tax=Anoxybacteroides amylolyticum TaxID=294699 RepID=A0A160F1N4_9BACL|nr:hypothetical protein [Anoxybacillus amylolyticus]ANB60069.1 hypothetical protein GFC30_742 [Anoxybacillus amylolyticus]
MKKRKFLLWLLLAAVVFGGLALFMNIGFGERMHGIMLDGPRHFQAFNGQPGMFHRGEFGEHRHIAFHHGIHGGMMAGGWMIFGMFALLFQLAMVVIGWIMWKTAKRSGWKWAGMALMMASILALLPKVLLIPFVLVVAYMFYKKQQTKMREPFEPMTVPITPIHDFLDEWERNIQKEGK